jgi:hypothetical protein
MKRMGAVYLQNCVCILPNLKGIRARLKEVATRVEAMSGSSYTFEIRKLGEPQLSEIVGLFRAQSDREYDEIVEECTTKFQKEIEFERFRQNYTYEEAEEIYSDLEKIRSWLARVVERDWFGSDRRAEAERQLAASEEAYEAFERDCYAASGGDGGEGAAVSRPLDRAPASNGSGERRRPQRRSGTVRAPRSPR